jgi:hypothetical protein
MISEKQATDAVARLTALEYFPSEAAARFEIARMFMRMVDDPKKLEWLVRTLVDRIGKYPGTREIRGVYCTRFQPFDGIEESSTLSGFSPADCEADYVKLQSQETNLRLADEREKQHALPGEVSDTPALPQIKPIAAPTRTERDLATRTIEEKLSGELSKPICIPATPVRSQEERDRLMAEMSRQLEELQKSERNRVN